MTNGFGVDVDVKVDAVTKLQKELEAGPEVSYSQYVRALLYQTRTDT
jgi:hypothetical protein